MNKNYYTVKSPTKREKWIIRIMITIGIFSIFNFFYFFFTSGEIGNLPLFLMLSVIFVYGGFRKIYLWYHYYDLSVPDAPKSNTQWKVDILTTYFPGEPYDMILKTLDAIQKIAYPHTAYLCDEADDPFLKEECKKMGVIHVTRDNRINAKAGNINNALKQATGDICVILDPDHIPQENFLEFILPHFENKEIGFVQIVQGYYNKYETLVARGAAEQTFQFYGPMMMTMNSYGTVNAIGANCTFRREALDSIGGHAPGLAEDMHTAMLLHAKGWKSVYVPKFLAKGLVPADLTSYYKQQLKWSRGTFDLLFKVYPKKFGQFSLRQKIHYALLPLHYAIGFIYLLAFLVPICSLLFSKMPWTGDFIYFILVSIPVYVSSFLIHTYIQKWVIEENERGFHMMGGLLQIISWWIYLLGIVYTLAGKKIPYLPTPKDEQKEIDYKILLPNILVAIASIFAIVYGLIQDFTPFTLVMSFFAGMNAVFMFLSFYLANSITNGNKMLRENLKSAAISKLSKMKRVFSKFFHTLFNWVRTMALPLTVIAVLLSANGINELNERDWDTVDSVTKEHRDFKYLGIFEPPGTTGVSDIGRIGELESTTGTNFNMISMYLPWGSKERNYLSIPYLAEIKKKGAIPLITWEPWGSEFTHGDSIPDLNREKHILRYIDQGVLDEYIKETALSIKNYGNLVFLRPAHEFDNPSYPWSETGGNTSADFKKAWIHMHNLFRKQNVNNVIWVWNPWHADKAIEYYPGDAYVDWVGITLLNYGALNKDSKWYSFDELYDPFDKTLNSIDKPIILTEFGSLAIGGNRKKWYVDAFRSINDEHQNIKGLVLFNSKYDGNIPNNTANYENKYLDWSISIDSILYETKSIKKKSLADLDSAWGFKVRKLNLPLKGVSYKKSDNWSENYYVANKDVLIKDFEGLKKIGAEMVKFNHSKVYRHNLLKYTDKSDLKVLYSFWLPDHLDFSRDKMILDKFKNEILLTIAELKENQNIVGWMIDNDQWYKTEGLYELLKKDDLRKDYLLWLKELTAEIKKIDSKRPLLKTILLKEQFEKQIAQIKQMHIKVDAFAVSPNEQDIFREFLAYSESNKISFLINEISVEDYLDSNKTEFLKNVPVIIKNWQDRRETGLVTFDGLLDFNGNKKQEFLKLKNSWLNQNDSVTFPEIEILRPAIPLLKGRHVRFSALIKNQDTWESSEINSGYVFKWYLIKYGQFENAIAMRKLKNGTYVDIEVPGDPSKHRILLMIEKNGCSTSILRSLNTKLYPGD